MPTERSRRTGREPVRARAGLAESFSLRARDKPRPVSEHAKVCGHLIVGGFDGTTLPDDVARALAAGQRAGVILFRRNLAYADGVLDVEQVVAQNRAIITATKDLDDPPFIAVDQEGGKVARLRAPVLELPPMRSLAAHGDPDLTARVGEELGRQLAALGFNLNFAPVMDVDSNPENPIIGDRSFGRDPRTVMRHGVAFVCGLQAAGVLACAKHFPGHGDTSVDSHLELPVVDADMARLAQIELPPFRAASGAGVASMMTAHVVYKGIDPTVPATFSRRICEDLLRREIGFEGVLFSDDLEMGAIAKHGSVEDAAIRAIEAGCDVLLVCSDVAAQERVFETLVREAEQNTGFFERCRVAAARSQRVRNLAPPRLEGDSARLRSILGSLPARELARRIAAEPA
ncbi:MAG: beta-N-acetylhexosaminidase [Deltaproteobacteria bacterium]|nr:beta-N-acetylhexosaminidase [Deltaproteobacteria bacterium]